MNQWINYIGNIHIDKTVWWSASLKSNFSKKFCFNSKKTKSVEKMGRKKIQISRITDERNRQVRQNQL